MAYAITCEQLRAGLVSPAGCGARANGVTDDTLAIREALARIAAQGGGTLWLPAGVYVVSPTETNGTIFALCSDLRIVGAGIGQTAIKVKDSSPPYGAIFAGAADNLVVESLTIDGNVAGNPIADLAELMGGGPRFSISVIGAGVRIRDVEITNQSAVNDLVLSGSDIRVDGCRWSNYGDDPNHIAHDASCIYTQSASGVRIEGCHFQGAAPGAPGARTAIETHGSDHIIRGNVVKDFNAGVNVTGVATSDSTGILVSGNVIEGASCGVLLWALAYYAHTSGFGIDGAVLEGNTIRLAQTGVWGGSDNYMAGIALYPLADLDVRGLKIRGNVIISPLEAEAIDANSVSCGIGWYSAAGKLLLDSDISSNTIVGFPMAGIRLSCGVRSVRVTDNQITNCGSTLDAQNDSYKSPVFVALAEGSDGLLLDRNTIRDTNAVTRNKWGLNLWTAGIPRVYVLDNVVDVTGDAASFLAPAYLSAGTAPTISRLWHNGIDVAA